MQAPSISSKGGHHDNNDDMEEQGGDNMDTTRMMLDWAEQNYSNSQYTQDQVDGRYPGERVRISLRRGIQHYVIKFISDLRQVGGFLLVLCYLHYDTTEILLKVALNSIP